MEIHLATRKFSSLDLFDLLRVTEENVFHKEYEVSPEKTPRDFKAVLF